MKLENKKMTEEEIKEANRKAIEMATGGAGDIPVSSESLGSYEELLKEKKRRNEEVAEGIKKRKLKGGMGFRYNLINSDDELKTITITYPPTSKAMKYQKFLVNPENSRLEIFFTDIVEDFVKDKLIQNFNIDDYDVSEITELAGFLTAVIQNPRLK